MAKIIVKPAAKLTREDSLIIADLGASFRAIKNERKHAFRVHRNLIAMMSSRSVAGGIKAFWNIRECIGAEAHDAIINSVAPYDKD